LDNIAIREHVYGARMPERLQCAPSIFDELQPDPAASRNTECNNASPRLGSF
jgi:hypothetical protein